VTRATSLIRVVRRDYERAIKVPAEYVARANAHGSRSYNAWIRARPANDFAAMIPFLENSLDLSCEYASFFAPYDHIADPMIDDADEGLTTATIQRLFAELRRGLIPTVRAICDQPPADDGCQHRSFSEAAQLGFGLSVATQMGYDLARGRLDKTPHPFCTKFAADDVRITTRVRENDLADALYSTLHEAGHAMYEQGVNSLRRDTAGERSFSRRPRKPVAAVGERGRTQSAVLGALLPGPSTDICRSARIRAARYLLSRHQQGRAHAHSHRR
jgi:carboxypeptidase Taq